MSWSRRFEEPIELPDGRKLKTLADAMAWLAKEMDKVQAAAYCVGPAPIGAQSDRCYCIEGRLSPLIYQDV